MQLISMTDFVLIDKTQENDFYYSITQIYASFLKQPLTLRMFVPCDFKGNILEEPCRDELSSFSEQAAEQYQLAKDRVLFEGFDVDRVQFYVAHKTVESLLQLDDFILTESALKEIGL